MNQTIEENRGKKTEFAKRAIVRYILDAKLRCGDRLPAQQELRERLNLSAATIVRAIQALKEEGILLVRDKVGVFVRTDQTDGLIGRTIGLLAVQMENSVFYAVMAQLLHQELLRQGCRAVLFSRKPLADDNYFVSADFPGLESAVRQHQIDGLIDTSGLYGELYEFLVRNRLPVTYVGSPWPVASGVVIDLMDFCRRALVRLREEGFRRPAVVIGGGRIRDYIWPEFVRGLEGFPDVRDAASLYLEAERVTDGRLLAARLLLRKPEERPDSVIFVDELIGSDFLAGLLVAQERTKHYRPQIISVCSRQQAAGMPDSRVWYFEKDPVALAEQAVRHLMRQLRSGEVRSEVEFYRFRAVPEVPFFFGHPEYAQMLLTADDRVPESVMH